MNNIQKAFKHKSDQGLRACYADGGSVMGFVKDRFAAAKDALTPKVVTTLRDAGLRRESAVEPAAPPPAPAPAEPVKEFRFASGGSVRGPGTSTSDSIPAMLSNDEYVLPADTVRAIGRENLEGLRAATHTPVNTHQRAGMPHMADGGIIENTRNWMAGKLAAGSVPADAMESVAGAPKSTPLPPIIDPSPPVTSAGSTAPSAQAGAGLRAGDWRSPTDTRPMTPPSATTASAAPERGLRFNTGTGFLGKAGQMLGGAGVGLSGALQAKQAFDQSRALDSDTDRAALAGEHVGRAAGAYLGGVGGATLGAMTGPAAPVMSPLLGLAGGAAGYFAPDAVKKASDLVGLTSAATPLPSEKANALIQAQGASAPSSLRGQAALTPATPLNPTTMSGTIGAAPDATPGAAPAGLRAEQPQVTTGADGVQTDKNNNPVAGTGSMTGPDGKKTYFTPGSGSGSTTELVRYRYTPSQEAGKKVATPLEKFADAVKNGSPSDVIAAKAGLRQEAAREALASATKTAQIGADASKYGHDASAAASRYGHELGLRQAQASRDQALAIHRDNLFQQDRQFKQAQGEADIKDRASSADALNKQLGTMFTTKDDKGNVVPDAARVGSASQAILNELGSRVADLQKVPKTDPNYARAQQMAAEISRKGHAALQPDDIQQLLSQAAIRDRVMATKSPLPGGASPTDSRLGDYAVKESAPNTFGSDTLTLRNGTKVRKNDLRYTEPANAVLPDWGKVPTDQFGAGLRGQN